MVQYVIKRDGRIVPFNKQKIVDVILKAFKATDRCEPDEYAKSKAENIATFIENREDEELSVEEIQDLVSKGLMSTKRKDVAEQFVIFRHDRTMYRENNLPLNKLIDEKLKATNVVNQNANVDEHSFGGRKGEAINAYLKEKALNNMPKRFAKNHKNNRVYIHDLDSYTLGMHNCLSLPLDDLLSKNVHLKQTDLRPANSVGTAMQLVAVYFQVQSLQQFGGVSATHLDWTMVPFVRASFFKHYRIGLKYVCGYCDELVKEVISHCNNIKEQPVDDLDFYHERNAYVYAMDMVKNELKQSCEGLFHNLNSLQSRSGNQLPFSSINYGTCTLPEGRMVIEALLNASISGVGPLHKTAIFPCSIFQYMKGVNDKPGTPNYDMFRLALKSTAKRLYPNYALVDWSGNAGYDINDPRTYFSTMGALAGHEHLTVRFNDEEPIDISIRELFEYFNEGKAYQGRKTQLFYNKPILHLPGNKSVQSPDFGYEAKPGVYSITYIPMDVTYFGSTSNISRRFNEHRSAIRKSGKLDAGPCFADTNLENYRFDVLEYTENYKEVEKKYILTEANINSKGVSNKFYKNIGQTNIVKDKPILNMNPNIPQTFIDLQDLNIKVLDIDNKWVAIKHIFKNDSHNTPYMMHIRYVENDKEYTLSCTEDHPLWVGDRFVQCKDLTTDMCLYRADNTPLKIVEVGWHWTRCESFDIGTESGTFIGSDIIMHNCRTANGFDINGFGQLKDGRGNIAPVTIILPTLAMEAKESFDNTYDDNIIDVFLNILDKAITDAKDELIERFEYICSQPADAADFMYSNGTMAGYVPEEGIRSALKHGTLAIGQLGLAETLQILIGKDHTTPEGMEVAKLIEQLYKTRCAEFKEKYKLNFGVYFSPAENLCHTAMKAFKKQYGEIPNVSDREYFTNSMHVPVWKKISPFDKIDIEAQLTGYSSAGCITYVELDTGMENNIDGLETLVTYAMNKDIPYFAINIPNDTCDECGECGDIPNACPVCGSNKITRLRRVTGYLSVDYHNFNKGKIAEVEDRYKHGKLIDWNNFNDC